jgi:hypothetical protein
MTMAHHPVSASQSRERQDLEHLVSREPFTGLKAILASLSSDWSVISKALSGTNSYAELLANLGYRILLTKQIHVQDAFTRLGRAGGIKAVLPYYDIPTQRSLPTLVHFDCTVTTTADAATFFDSLVVALKDQWTNPR